MIELLSFLTHSPPAFLTKSALHSAIPVSQGNPIPAVRVTEISFSEEVSLREKIRKGQSRQDYRKTELSP